MDIWDELYKIIDEGERMVRVLPADGAAVERARERGADAALLGLDEGFSFYPPLFTKAESMEARSRRAVPMAEPVGLELEMKKQLDRGE